MTAIIQTKRLLLRPLTVADAPQMFQNWASSETVTQYLTWTPHTTLEQTKARLSLREALDDEDWGIVMTETNRAVLFS